MAEENKTTRGGKAGSESLCRIEKCKQGVRAKGFCRKHYIGWRREAVGDHHRYNTCSKEACRKKAVGAGLCEEHGKKSEA